MADNNDTKRGLLGRLFIDMMGAERRALLGTLLFFLTILVFGWIAIQEPTRLGTFADQYEGRAISRGAVLFRDNCASCHGIDGQGIPGQGPSLSYESFWDGSRAADVGWAGSQYDFVYLTVAAGRPVVHPNYNAAMPTWSQEYGGPMRTDQVRDVVAYVMNFQLDPVSDGEVFLPYDLTDVAEEEPLPDDIGAQVLEETIAVAALQGDASAGEALYTEQGCVGCHSLDGSNLVGPSFLGITERFPYEGYELPEGIDEAESVDGLTYYLVESIWYPSLFEAPNANGVMPATYKETLSEQDLADLIAFILQDVNSQ